MALLLEQGAGTPIGLATCPSRSGSALPKVLLTVRPCSNSSPTTPPPLALRRIRFS